MKFAGRGTLLNAFTVALGSSLGLLVGDRLPHGLQTAVMTALGLAVAGIGLKMFLKVHNVLVVVGSMAAGSLVGTALGINIGLAHVADWLKVSLGGGGGFQAGFIGATVLFCVGPMTLLGCLEDGLQGKIELLSLKSLLDGIASFFLAVSLGFGVLVSAASVLVVQGILTLLAKPLQPVAKNGPMLDDVTSVGGLMVFSIGLGLAGVAHFLTENYVPALFISPGLTILALKCLPKAAATED